MGRNLTTTDRKRRLENVDKEKNGGNSIKKVWEFEKSQRKIQPCKYGCNRVHGNEKEKQEKKRD